MSDYWEQRKRKERREDWFITILGLVVGIGLVVAGIIGIVTSLIAADDYENRTDTLTVDAVIEKLSISDEKHDAEGIYEFKNESERLFKRSYRMKVSFVVDGNSYKGKYELVAYADNPERKQAYDQLEVGDTIQVKVYRSRDGDYKIESDLNPVNFLLYCVAIPVGLVVTSAMVFDIYSKRPGAPQKEPDKKEKQQKQKQKQQQKRQGP